MSSPRSSRLFIFSPPVLHDLVERAFLNRDALFAEKFYCFLGVYELSLCVRFELRNSALSYLQSLCYVFLAFSAGPAEGYFELPLG